MPPVRAVNEHVIYQSLIKLLTKYLGAHLGGFVTGLIMYGFITTEKEEVYKRSIISSL